MDSYEKSLQTLELPSVLALLAAQAVSETARAQAMALRPSGDRAVVATRLGETSAAASMMVVKGSPSFSGVKDVRAALQAPIEEMVLHIKDTFKKTNPDLASDIIQNGILLTGGGGLLSGLDRYLTDKLEIPVWVSETALTNVVSGCLKVLETPTALKQTLMRSK